MAAGCSLIHVEGPTAVIDVGGVRLLTDPTFDPPGQQYSFGFGTGSIKTAGPAIGLEGLGAIDAVLLSHDQHDDNLDRTGRDALNRAGKVLTTVAAARRLGGNATGLRPWEAAVITGAESRRITITATPARHGAPGISLLSGPTIGFLLEWPGQENGGLYISGDTVWFSGIEAIAERFQVSVAVLHFGGVRFLISGPARYTFDAAEGLRAATALRARTVVPVHYEGWTHFRTPRPAIESTFAAAGKAELLRWPVLGGPIELDV
jgi:L-ascorbate metabolism protein UlaG (beta-lactamase superfamily)